MYDKMKSMRKMDQIRSRVNGMQGWMSDDISEGYDVSGGCYNPPRLADWQKPKGKILNMQKLQTIKTMHKKVAKNADYVMPQTCHPCV